MSAKHLEDSANRWQVKLPDAYVMAFDRLGPNAEFGLWRLIPDAMETERLQPGAPLGLYPIAISEFGDLLCLYPSPTDAEQLQVVMWSPESLHLTLLGRDFEDFLQSEAKSRIEFLTEQGASLSPADLDAIRAGRPVTRDEPLDAASEMLAEFCGMLVKLDLPDSVLTAATEVTEDEPAESEQKPLDEVVADLWKQVSTGDAGAGFDLLALNQAQQNVPETLRAIMALFRCLLVCWPDFSKDRLANIALYVKEHSTEVPPAERIDLLYGFLTKQNVTTSSGRMALAKQYQRKGQIEGAIREAQNAMFLAQQGPKEGDVVRDELVVAYRFLVDLFTKADLQRELTYCESMSSRLERRS